MSRSGRTRSMTYQPAGSAVGKRNHRANESSPKSASRAVNDATRARLAGVDDVLVRVAGPGWRVDEGTERGQGGGLGTEAVHPDRQGRDGFGPVRDVDVEDHRGPLARRCLEDEPLGGDRHRRDRTLGRSCLEREPDVVGEGLVGTRDADPGVDSDRVEGPPGELIRDEDEGATVGLRVAGERGLDRDVRRHVRGSVLVEGDLDARVERHVRGGVVREGRHDVERLLDREGPAAQVGSGTIGEREPVGRSGREGADRMDGRRRRVGPSDHGERGRRRDLER